MTKHLMIKIVAALALCAVLLGFAVAGSSVDATPDGVAASTDEGSVPAPVDGAALVPATDDGAAACGAAIGVTEDALSCSAGGWTYVGCCIGKSRWTRPGQVKCCGACMQ